MNEALVSAEYLLNTAFTCHGCSILPPGILCARAQLSSRLVKIAGCLPLLGLASRHSWQCSAQQNEFLCLCVRLQPSRRHIFSSRSTLGANSLRNGAGLSMANSLATRLSSFCRIARFSFFCTCLEAPLVPFLIIVLPSLLEFSASARESQLLTLMESSPWFCNTEGTYTSYHMLRSCIGCRHCRMCSSLDR